jgi:Family of unknown function (DUF5677)
MPRARAPVPRERPTTELGWVQPTDEKVRDAAQSLVALVEAHLPQRIYRERVWRLYCVGMIVRMLDTVEALLAFMDADKPVDGAILLRALYEEVVGFLWIATNPDERLGRWMEGARYYGRKMHLEALAYDMTILSSAELAETKDARQMPDLAQRAAQVDKHWGGRLTGFRRSMGGPEDILTIKGLYVAIYRYRAGRRMPSQMPSIPM